MTDETTHITAASFTGQWIGETIGYEMPAHLWEIHQQGNHLLLMTRWEGETSFGTFDAWLIPGESAFEILNVELDHNKALLIDKQHFVIPRWCYGTIKGERKGLYDVIFSRPGIAELTAHAAYETYRNRLAQTPPEDDAS